VQNVQKTQVKLVTVVADLVFEFLECSERVLLDTGVKFPPEIGGTNTLADFTLFKKLHSICERFRQSLLLLPYIFWLLFQQGRISTLFENPGNFSAVAERLYNCVCVTGHSHIHDSSKLRI
jgi:hypothetical protein